MREESNIDRNCIDDIIKKLNSSYVDEWLIRYELMELLSRSNLRESHLYIELRSNILHISKSNIDLNQSVLRGIQSLE